MNKINASQVVAHRGWQNKYPENTLLSIQKAIDAGVLHIECDVQMTGDGHLLLCHDVDLKRLSGKKIAINEHALADIQALSCFEPERLGNAFEGLKFASLAELLPIISAYPSVQFYIELKEEAIEQQGLDACLKALAALLIPFKNTVFISFNERAVKLAKQQYGFERTSIVLRTWGSRNEVIRAVCADVAYISKRHLPNDGDLRAAVPLAVYEIAELAEAKSLLARGVSMIESFCSPDLIEGSAGNSL